MTEQKQSKIPSLAAMLKRRSGKPRRQPSEPGATQNNKTPSLTGECSSGGAGVGDKRRARPMPGTDPDLIKNNPQVTAAVEILSPPEKPAQGKSVQGRPVTDYVLGPLQMHCLREFAAGRCERLEITPAYKVPFIDGVSIGRSSENRSRPATMRCERRIYSRETGAFAYISLRLISSELRASRCSRAIEGELGIRYEDGEDSGVF
jgi:hypothetical protein